MSRFVCIFPREPGSGVLMVDKLVAQLGNEAVSKWVAKGGSQQYPPMSLHVCT